MKYDYLLMLTLSVVTVTEGKKYCLGDDDCTELGDLYCIKSHCNRGICGCPRGEAAVFLGSKHKYGCVKVKRVGESCSTAGDGGICGAAGSECNKDDKCACTGGLVAQWGGERCGTDDARYAGETCSPNGALGACVDSSVCSSPESSIYWYNPVRLAVPTCACANNHKLVITNAFSYPDTTDINPFVGSSYPTCVPRKIGDSCLRDTDCPSDGKCSENKICVCTESTYVPDYFGTTCFKPLAFGKKCKDVADYVCDGTLGLVCGDQCSMDDNYPGTDDATCTCGPMHSKSGTSCTAIGLGDACFGDNNCKDFSDNGICVDGKCQNGGFRLTLSVPGLLLLLAFALQHNMMT